MKQVRRSHFPSTHARTASARRWLMLSVVAACWAGCGGRSADSAAAAVPAELPTVKVAINTWPGLGPFFVAAKKGFDREEGIVLDVVMTESAEARGSSLVSGEVDLVGITLDTVVIASSRGVPMVVVGKSDFSYGGDGIIARDEIKKVADLKGKRVACAEGLPSHFLLLNLLRRDKLGPRDVQLVPADDGGQAAFLFTSGSVDAAVTWDPWISQAEKLTRGHVLVTTREAPGLLLGIVAANKNYLPQRADRLTRAMRAWFKAVAYVRDHPDEAAPLMAKEFNVSLDDFTRMAAGAKLADLEDNRRTFGSAAQPGPVRQLALDASDVWLQAGVTTRAVAPEDVIDWRVLEAVGQTQH